jgi:hypothetical protein
MLVGDGHGSAKTASIDTKGAGFETQKRPGQKSQVRSQKDSQARRGKGESPHSPRAERAPCLKGRRQRLSADAASFRGTLHEFRYPDRDLRVGSPWTSIVGICRACGRARELCRFQSWCLEL